MGVEKQTVDGIGGFFFKARDPEMLARWYEEHLGINLVPTSYEGPVWEQEPGPTVFAPFPETSEMFGKPEQAWMLNFRVRDLAAMTRQLTAAGAVVTVDPETYPNGLFAQTSDPEGNPIQLWEPQENPVP